jgi:acyl carrier protein
LVTNSQVLERLRAIWEENLGIAVDDVDADFFDLGGDSLVALSIAAQAIDDGLAMPRSGVLRCGTLRRLAAAVEDSRLFEVA